MAGDDQRGRGFSTRAIKAATGGPRLEQRSTATPIYQSATFSTIDADELGDVLTGARPGYAYSRIDNPTAAAMAAAVAELEGAPAGYAFGTGMAAIHAAVTSVAGAGDHVVASKALYGSVIFLFDRVLRRLGIETTFVDVTDADAVDAALRPDTRLLYLETIANPTIVVADVAELIERAHRRGVTVAVDNTFASPYLCRPFELGADLVIESCTKWIGGHSDVMAGTVSCGLERIEPLREVAVQTGGIVAPFSAFLVLRGLETLAVRMERHSQSAAILARMLEARPDVRRVWYPGLPSHPQAGVAQRLLRSGGGMLAFDVGSRAAAAACIDALAVPERTASLGSVHTIAMHPPSTSHRQLDDAELERAGIPPGMVRVSVGLEDVEDLVADFTAALDAVASAIPA